jgi:heterotetrameric sarcosine oxidase gamma subunit
MPHSVAEKFRNQLTPLTETVVNPQEGLSSPQPAAIIIVEGATEAQIRATAPGKRLLWLGPTKWLVVSETQPPRELSVKLALTLDTTALTDVSHGFFRIRLRGSQVRDILAAGISLDLHPSVFKTGQSAPCAWRSIYIVLHAVTAASFDIYAPRSYAGSLWEELADAAALIRRNKAVINKRRD